MDYIIALDVETGGEVVTRHDLLAVGLVGIEVQSRRVLAALELHLYIPSESRFSDRCWREFWQPRAAILDSFKSPFQRRFLALEDGAEQVLQFRETLQRQQQGADFKVVSDNPGYDIKWVYFLTGAAEQTYQPPLNYTLGDNYPLTRPQQGLPLRRHVGPGTYIGIEDSSAPWVGAKLLAHLPGVAERMRTQDAEYKALVPALWAECQPLVPSAAGVAHSPLYDAVKIAAAYLTAQEVYARA